MRILTYLFFSVMISTLFLPVDYGFSACHFTAATSLLSSTFLKSKSFIIFAYTAHLFFLIPSDVEAVNSPCVASMQCDSEHCCVVTHEGSATCWGRGGFIGQLGLGPLLNGSNPNWGDEAGEMGSDFPFVDVGKSVTVVQVATGSGHTCALLSDASLKCWGLNA